jgi:hypothetical protein
LKSVVLQCGPKTGEFEWRTFPIVLGIALASLGKEGFLAAIRKASAFREGKKGTQELSKAYQELLKRDPDMSIVEAALDAAAKRGDTSASHVQLRDAFKHVGGAARKTGTAKKKARKGKAAKKTGKKKATKKAASKKAAKNR